MKAMILRRITSLADNDAPLELVELPAPEPGPGEVRVRVSVCGVCHTELDEIEGRAPPPRLPVIPGHEVVGRVAALGPGCRRFREGDRVGVAGADHAVADVDHVGVRAVGDLEGLVEDQVVPAAAQAPELGRIPLRIVVGPPRDRYAASLAELVTLPEQTAALDDLAELHPWEVFEVEMTAERELSSPYVEGLPEGGDSYVSVTFQCESCEAQGQKLTVTGFWDGDQTWRVRFAPPAPGEAYADELLQADGVEIGGNVAGRLHRFARHPAADRRRCRDAGSRGGRPVAGIELRLRHVRGDE